MLILIMSHNHTKFSKFSQCKEIEEMRKQLIHKKIYIPLLLSKLVTACQNNKNISIAFILI